LLSASRWPGRLAVGAVLAGALGLRLWGIASGLPYVYNADENSHFVPGAIGLFGHGLNPHYFVNPPAYTYLLHVVFAVWFGGRGGVSEAFATHPTEVLVVARVTAAVVGTVAVWLLYLAGTRLADRRVGLLAAALMAVAFLPVFYAHLALNDVPTLAPIGLSLWGTAGVLRSGRRRDYLVAGAGLGLACATKYTGGVVLLALLGAVAWRLAAPAERGRALRGVALAGAAAVACFLAANPYALLDATTFRHDLGHQASTSDEGLGKLGQTQRSGHLYYLWTLTWGLGWAPLAAALAGLGLLARENRRLLAVLAPAPILYVLVMGLQGRYFGRWLLPVFPLVCLLAAYGAVRLVELGGARRRRRWRPALAALAVAALLGQGLVYSVHGGLVLSRPDTRNLARAWLVAHVPAGTKVVVEPVVPDAWASDVGRVNPGTSNGARWVKFPTTRSRLYPGRVVNLEDYERTLEPALLDRYAAGGYCWVVSASTQRGRSEAQPEQVPGAVRYYRELDRRAALAFEASPFDAGARPVGFDYDWTFDYYPLAYHRPGPVVRIYRLSSQSCAPR
jgi:4-amino-4-deoxy-L-arabinose transferase-like glycosyltransferase